MRGRVNAPALAAAVSVTALLLPFTRCAGSTQERLARAKADEVLLARLTAAFQEGRHAAVLLVFTDTLKGRVLNGRLLNLEGLTLAAVGRHSEAVAAYEDGIRRDSGLFELHMNLALSLQELGKPGRAVAELQQACELGPEQVDAHLALGRALTGYRRFNLAEKALASAARLAPSDPRVLEARARLADSCGAADVSLSRWKLVEQAAPTTESARRLGQLQATQDPAQAAAWFKLCAGRDSSAADCLAAAGTAWLRAADPVRAVEPLREAVERQLGEAREASQQNLLLALQALHRRDELEVAVSRHPPQRGVSWGVVASARRDAGDLTGALQAARRGSAMAPEDLDLANLLGVLLLETGDLAGARERWQWVLAHDPGHAQARQNLDAHPAR